MCFLGQAALAGVGRASCVATSTDLRLQRGGAFCRNSFQIGDDRDQSALRMGSLGDAQTGGGMNSAAVFPEFLQTFRFFPRPTGGYRSCVWLPGLKAQGCVSFIGGIVGLGC